MGPHCTILFQGQEQHNNKENANKAKDDDDYSFATKDGDHCKAICKWIMDSGATKHMTPHRAAFDTYEVIPTRNVHMGDDSIVEAIGMGSILVQVMVKGRTQKPNQGRAPCAKIACQLAFSE
jgi:hypothetical protein